MHVRYPTPTLLLCCLLQFVSVGHIVAIANEPTTRSSEKVRAEPLSINAYPESVEFQYPTDQQQILLQANFSDGSTHDVTSHATVTLSDPTVVATTESGLVAPVGKGETTLAFAWNGLECKVAVHVLGTDTPRPLRFRNDILPVFTRAGCNAGKCHGSASGKDGFRLSLYGFDPEGDYFRLTREASGRRINLSKPDDCLLVNKAVGRVPHTGGVCIQPGSKAYRKLVSWIALGAEPDPAATPLPVRIDVYPKRSVMSRPQQSQQMLVLAQYDDGTQRDVTSLSVFLSNNDATATVSADGQVTGTGPGTAFMLARFDQFTSGTAIVVRSGLNYPEPEFVPSNYIDELALARWRDLHVLPSELCSDEAFVRRLYLDTVGLLPTLEQRDAFVNDPATEKREALIEQLTNSPDFLEMWTMKLAEMLQIRRANGLSSKGLQLYDAWLREKVRAGMTFDKILLELIPASGSTFENPATSYYQTETTPQLLAENIAQAFLGTRIQCAQCHNHPFDRWTMDDYYGFAAFVSQVGYKQAKDPREITVYNLGTGSLQHPVAGREVRPKFLGGDVPQLDAGSDYREALAKWLTSPNNTAFANNIANVLWEHYTGKGIVDAVDDVRVSNPPSNPELLNALGKKLVEYEFDVRRLAQDILNSKTYQLETQSTAWNEWDDRNFSHARIRRLRAEVLLDCINQVTLGKDSLAGLPLGGRAIQVPDAQSNNYFLETFGRASRNTPCSCEVSTSPTLSQALHLMNGENTSGKIQSGGWISSLLADGREPLEIAESIYLACYSRKPLTEEREQMASRFERSEDVESDLSDLFWAVLNSNEFVFNH